MREIGGYFELERFGGRAYHEGAVALNSGRGCLSYLVELRGVRTVWLPDLMCVSVGSLFGREGVRVREYPVGPDLLPDYGAFEVGGGEWMLLCDYYGQLRAGDVERARAFCAGRLIVDETQGFFRDPWPGADTVYSCRKWFGVADGGYLATGDGARLGRALARDESHARMGFVLGRFERPASEFYAEAAANNGRFAGEPAKLMSPLTENVLRAVDYEAVRGRRVGNFGLLHAALGAGNLLEVREPCGPFMYPLMVEDAAGVREALAREKVFVPTLWPNVLEDCPESSCAYRVAKNVLPLPVDQRYGEREMKHVASTVRRLLG